MRSLLDFAIDAAVPIAFMVLGGRIVGAAHPARPCRSVLGGLVGGGVAAVGEAVLLGHPIGSVVIALLAFLAFGVSAEVASAARR